MRRVKPAPMPRVLNWATALAFVASVHAAAAEGGKDLPDGLDRFNPAGLGAEWVYEGTAFREYVQAPAGVSTVAVTRMHHPTLGYLLAASDAEVQSAAKGGWAREGTAFHAPTAGPVVYRFKDPHSGTVSYSLERDEAGHSGLTFDGPAFHAVAGGEAQASTVAVARYRHQGSTLELYTAGHESPYRVGVFYFGSFSPSAKNIVAGTQKIHGRADDWWGGVDDFYGAEPGIPPDRRGWSGSWADLKPAIGYYDQSKVTTLEQHINQAADAGLAFFSFYWYWSRAHQGELLPEALASFQHARNRDRLQFNLTLYAHPWDPDMAILPADRETVVSGLLRYFGDPQYLRLPDGRPVFSIGDSRNVRDDDGKACTDVVCNQRALGALIDLLRKRTRERLGVEPFIQVQAGVPAWDKQAGVDGITCLVPPFSIAGGTPYPQFDPGEFAPMRNTGKPFSPCMLENFDERPRQDVLVADRNAIRYLTGKTDAAFRHNLALARQVADADFSASHSPAAHIIYLYAWNEWHEGGILEPNAHTGAHDLNLVTDVFQLPRAPSACLDQGKCTVP